MAQSALECANAALIKLGNSTISSLSDTDKAATTCNARIDVVKKALLRSHPWNFAINRNLLEPSYINISNSYTLGDNGDPTTMDFSASHGLSNGDRVLIENHEYQVASNGVFFVGVVDSNTLTLTDSVFDETQTGDAATGTLTRAGGFDYAYSLALPTDCLRLLNVGENGLQEDYKVEGGRILTNETQLYVKYIKDITDYTLMDALFYECLSAHLAWDICFQITQSNELKDQLWKDFRAQLAHAKFVDATEDSLQTFESNDWITARSETLGS